MPLRIPKPTNSDRNQSASRFPIQLPSPSPNHPNRSTSCHHRTMNPKPFLIAHRFWFHVWFEYQIMTEQHGIGCSFVFAVYTSAFCQDASQWASDCQSRRPCWCRGKTSGDVVAPATLEFRHKNCDLQHFTICTKNCQRFPNPLINPSKSKRIPKSFSDRTRIQNRRTHHDRLNFAKQKRK